MNSPYLFMLALPRSGSKLLAYVLDSHLRIHHVDLIAQAFGGRARFILLTRRRMWRTFYDADGRPLVVARRQLLQFAVCRRHVALRYPHLQAAYEDLVTQPDRAFARVCDFIGVAFEPEMLNYAAFPHPHLSQRGNTKTRRFGRIVDTVAREQAAGRPLLREAFERLGIAKGTRPE